MQRVLLFSSLGLNAALVAGLCWALTTPPVITMTAPAVSTVVITPPVVASTRWSDLESDDFLLYLAHLRAAGCPEPTAKAILESAIRERYAPREAGASASRLVSLRAEETALFNRLFELSQPAVARVETARTAAPVTEPPALPLVPLAWMQLDEASELNDEQRQRLEELRQEFQAELAEVTTDPDDVRYLQAWQRLQPVFDERVKSQLGWQVYGELVAQGARLGRTEEERAGGQ